MVVVLVVLVVVRVVVIVFVEMSPGLVQLEWIMLFHVPNPSAMMGRTSVMEVLLLFI